MRHEGSAAREWHTASTDQQAPPAASSLQSLLQSNPGILKTIQPNDTSGLPTLPLPSWCAVRALQIVHHPGALSCLGALLQPSGLPCPCSGHMVSLDKGACTVNPSLVASSTKLFCMPLPPRPAFNPSFFSHLAFANVCTYNLCHLVVPPTCSLFIELPAGCHVMHHH